MSDTVKVKRVGPKGYHIIDLAKYDPAIHELYDPPETPPQDEIPEPVPVSPAESSPKTSRSKK